MSLGTSFFSLRDMAEWAPRRNHPADVEMSELPIKNTQATGGWRESVVTKSSQAAVILTPFLIPNIHQPPQYLSAAAPQTAPVTQLMQDFSGPDPLAQEIQIEMNRRHSLAAPVIPEKNENPAGTPPAKNTQITGGWKEILATAVAHKIDAPSSEANKRSTETHSHRLLNTFEQKLESSNLTVDQMMARRDDIARTAETFAKEDAKIEVMQAHADVAAAEEEGFWAKNCFCCIKNQSCIKDFGTCCLTSLTTAAAKAARNFFCPGASCCS